MCVAGTFWMERHSSSGSIGERLTRAIRTDAGASKSVLRVRNARLPFSTRFSTRASSDRRNHSFVYPPPFSNFSPFRMQLQLFETYPPPQMQMQSLTLHGTFSVLLSDIIIWPSRGPVCFRPHVLISLRLCITPLPHPPSSIILYVYH